jgi:hypothetical protein
VLLRETGETEKNQYKEKIFAETLCKFEIITASKVTSIAKSRKIIIVKRCQNAIHYVTFQIEKQ